MLIVDSSCRGENNSVRVAWGGLGLRKPKMTLVTEREHLRAFQCLSEVAALADCTFCGLVFYWNNKIGNTGVRKEIGEHGQFLTRRHSPLSNGGTKKT